MLIYIFCFINFNVSMQTFPVKICNAKFLFLPVSPHLFSSIPQFT